MRSLGRSADYVNLSALPRVQTLTTARRYSVAATRPPIIRIAGRLRARIVWIDNAHSGEARRSSGALLHRGIVAVDVATSAPAELLQADRIVPAISLGRSRRGRQNHDGRQNRQSRNAHRNLPRVDVTASTYRYR